MKNLVANFSKQLQTALDIAKAATFTTPTHTLQNVLISGLGGSGIGGTIVKELIEDNATLPINITKDYFLPAFVNENTLVIICSYSGNTEETVNVMELALQKNAKVVCITSGGKVQELAESNKLDCVIIPGGMPPRSCIGYSITQLFNILENFGVCSVNSQAEIAKSITLLDSEENDIIHQANSLSLRLMNKLPVIYSLGATEGVSIRFRQQLNENSKMLCWHHVLPEMNHNELVARPEKTDNIVVVVWRYETDYPRNVKRLEICESVFSKFTKNIIEINTKGTSAIQRALYAIHLGDWVSVLIADLKHVDATDISIIAHLKDELSKVN
jgi:glucose/mannose-6-phosphate isomerase